MKWSPVGRARGVLAAAVPLSATLALAALFVACSSAPLDRSTADAVPVAAGGGGQRRLEVADPDDGCRRATEYGVQQFGECAALTRYLRVPDKPDCRAYDGGQFRLTVQPCGGSGLEHLRGFLFLTSSDGASAMVELDLLPDRSGRFVWESDCYQEPPVEVTFHPYAPPGEPAPQLEAKLDQACCECDRGTPEPTPTSGPDVACASVAPILEHALEPETPYPFLELQCAEWSDTSVMQVTITAPEGHEPGGTIELYFPDGSAELVEAGEFWSSPPCEEAGDYDEVVVTVFPYSESATVVARAWCCECCAEEPPPQVPGSCMDCPSGYRVQPEGEAICICCSGT